MNNNLILNNPNIDWSQTSIDLTPEAQHRYGGRIQRQSPNLPHYYTQGRMAAIAESVNQLVQTRTFLQSGLNSSGPLDLKVYDTRVEINVGNGYQDIESLLNSNLYGLQIDQNYLNLCQRIMHLARGGDFGVSEHISLSIDAPQPKLNFQFELIEEDKQVNEFVEAEIDQFIESGEDPTNDLKSRNKQLKEENALLRQKLLQIESKHVNELTELHNNYKEIFEEKEAKIAELECMVDYNRELHKKKLGALIVLGVAIINHLDSDNKNTIEQLSQELDKARELQKNQADQTTLQSHITELETKLKEANKLVDEGRGLTTQNAQLQNEINAKAQKIEGLTNEAENLNQLLQNEKNIHSKLSKEIETLSNQITGNKTEIKRLRTEASDNNKKKDEIISLLKTQNQTLTEELSKLSNDASSKDNKILQLERSLQDVQNKLNQSVKESEETIASLGETVHSLSSEIEGLNDTVERLNDENRSLDSSIAKKELTFLQSIKKLRAISRELSHTSEVIENLKGQLLRAQKKHSQLTTQHEIEVSEFSIEISDKNSQIEELEETLTEQSKQIDTLSKKLEAIPELKRIIREQELSLLQNKELINDHEERLTLLTSKNERLENDIASLNRQIIKKQKEYSALGRKNQSLEDEINDLTEELQSKKKHYDTYKLQQSALFEEHYNALDKLNTQIQEQQKTISDASLNMSHQNEMHSLQVDQLHSKIETLNNTISRLEETNEHAQNQIAILNQESHSANEANHAAHQKLETLKAEYLERLEEISELENSKTALFETIEEQSKKMASSA